MMELEIPQHEQGFELRLRIFVFVYIYTADDSRRFKFRILFFISIFFNEINFPNKIQKITRKCNQDVVFLEFLKSICVSIP